jgi:hypothetical protein
VKSLLTLGGLPRLRLIGNGCYYRFAYDLFEAYYYAGGFTDKDDELEGSYAKALLTYSPV